MRVVGLLLLMPTVAIETIACSDGQGTASTSFAPTPTTVLEATLNPATKIPTAHITMPVVQVPVAPQPGRDCGALLTPEKVGTEEYAKFKIDEKLREDQFQRTVIGDRIVCWHERTIEYAKVENDYLNYRFNRHTGEFLDKRIRWRDDLPEHLPSPLLTYEEAKVMVEGEVMTCELYFISPESVVFGHIKPTPENPCWIIRTTLAQQVFVTVIDAVTGEELGGGVPPPRCRW